MPNVKKTSVTISLIVGLSLIIATVCLLFFFPNTNDKQFLILRILVSLGSAGVAATIPGFFHFKYKGLVSAGGALAVFAFVFLLNPAQLTTESFSFTVYVHGNKGLQDLIKTKGNVIVDLGGDRRIEKIDDNGSAFIKGVPPSFINQKVRISIDAETYTLTKDSMYEIFNNAAVYLEIIHKDLDEVKGVIFDDKLKFVYKATVQIDDLTTQTDSLGRFTIKIPEQNQRRVKKIIVSKDGFTTWIGDVTPETKEVIQIKLSK